jgi:hypothetical protein
MKPLLTKSKDGCFVIVFAEKKTHVNDLFISQATLQKNIKEKTFIKHDKLTYNERPLYIYHEDC